MAKRVIVIGGGTAGICSAKNAIQEGFQVTVFEQSSEIGGIWNYKENEEDENAYGVPRSYMYKDLRTNAPKEIMKFTDFDVKSDKSFLGIEDVFGFLNDYTDSFDLRRFIKLNHQVVRVSPLKGQRWEVLVKDLESGIYSTETSDYVMICNGHYSVPIWPTIPGQELFPSEEQKHSYTFRKKEIYQGKRVLVIGSGASALDIATLIAECAEIVFFSNHFNLTDKMKVAENIVLKPDVEEITATGAVFKDGTSCEVDSILYCTGFAYSFPFLSTDCGIYVEDSRIVKTLFKHTINVKYPTMAFIGMDYLVLIQMHFDIQAQFVCKFWKSGKKLPSIEEILKDNEEDLQKRLDKGWKKKHTHKMGEFMGDYYRQLAEIVEIFNVPKVYFKIYEGVVWDIITNNEHFRDYHYRLIDEENYEKNLGPFEENSKETK